MLQERLVGLAAVFTESETSFLYWCEGHCQSVCQNRAGRQSFQSYAGFFCLYEFCSGS